MGARTYRWVHSLGKGSLETTAFEGNKKIRRVELSASAHQMCILLLFNDADELTFEKIRETLQVADAKTMAKNMDSLCEKKYPLLLKTEVSFHLAYTNLFPSRSNEKILRELRCAETPTRREKRGPSTERNKVARAPPRPPPISSFPSFHSAF